MGYRSSSRVTSVHQSIISDFSDSLGAGLTGNRSPRVTRLGGLGLPRSFASHLESLAKLTKLLQSGSEWHTLTVGPAAT